MKHHRAEAGQHLGSGVYLTEVVGGSSRQGHEQAVLAGVYREDEVRLPAGVDFFPFFLLSEELPFAIPGTGSDRMPYESAVYSAMDEGTTETLHEDFPQKDPGGGGKLSAGPDPLPSPVPCDSPYKGLREGDSCLWLLHRIRTCGR